MTTKLITKNLIETALEKKKAERRTFADLAQVMGRRDRRIAHAYLSGRTSMPGDAALRLAHWVGWMELPGAKAVSKSSSRKRTTTRPNAPRPNGSQCRRLFQSKPAS